MIPHSLAIAGLHAFPEPVELDLDALPVVIAITGDNGAGKTTLLDALMAPLIGEMPYRPGSLTRQFTATGYIELIWTWDGKRYASRIDVNPDTGKTEGCLWGEDGLLIAGPLIRDYWKAVQKIVGLPEILLASAYSVQSGVGAFLYASRAARKAILAELLGLQRFTRYSTAIKARITELDGEQAGLRGRIAELTPRAAQCDEYADWVRKMTAFVAVVQSDLEASRLALDSATEAQSKAVAARSALAPVVDEERRTGQQMEAIQRTLTDLRWRLSQNADMIPQATAIRAAVGETSELRLVIEGLDEEIRWAQEGYQDDVAKAQQRQRTREMATDALRDMQANRDRLTRQSLLLHAVPCEGAGIYAACTLLTDAQLAATGLPAVDAGIRFAEKALALLPALDTPKDPATGLLVARRGHQARITKLAALVTLLPRLEAAEARIEELTREIQTRGEEYDKLAATRRRLAVELAQRPALEAAVQEAEQAVRQARGQYQSTQDETTAAQRALGQVEAQHQAARDAADALAAAELALGPIQTDLCDWTLLADAVSPTGIPALLIDQALPELSMLATDFLRDAYGESVFSITLTTQRESAAGDKLLETLDVIVSRGGTPIDAALLSGGERVLVSEALSLAIAVFMAGRSGRRVGTLIRDEVGAALDRDRAPAYVRMLRRAATLGDFKHVLVVSHQQAAIDQADAVLVVGGGRIELQ